jgi:hypothetical protein
MLANKHKCFVILHNLQESGMNVSPYVLDIERGTIPKIVVEELVKQNDSVCSFYLTLNNKAHKIIKEILTCEDKPVSTYIKIATSIITQGTIAIEHQFKDDINGQNEFIECLNLKELSGAISEYFNTGNYESLVIAVNKNKSDVKALLD